MTGEIVKKTNLDLSMVDKRDASGMCKCAINNYNLFYGQGEFQKLMPANEADKLRACASLGSFLVRSGSGTIKKIFDDATLKMQFLARLQKIALDTNFDFDYAYCYVRGANALMMGIQYQSEAKAIKKAGFQYQIIYVMQGDSYSEKMVFDENGKATKTMTLETGPNHMNFFEQAPEDLDTKITKNDAVKLYKQLKFAIVNVENGGKKFNLTISKAEYHSSLKASFEGDKTPFKLRNGLRAMLDITTTHILYKRLLLNSFEDDDELDEARAQNINEQKKNKQQVKNVDSIVDEQPAQDDQDLNIAEQIKQDGRQEVAEMYAEKPAETTEEKGEQTSFATRFQVLEINIKRAKTEKERQECIKEANELKPQMNDSQETKINDLFEQCFNG